MLEKKCSARWTSQEHKSGAKIQEHLNRHLDNSDINAQQAGIHYMVVSLAYMLVCIVFLFTAKFKKIYFQPDSITSFFSLPSNIRLLQLSLTYVKKVIVISN